MCNSFLLCLFKVKVKLEPHEEQIFVDDDDEVSVSYMYLQYRPCFIVLKVYLFYPEKNSSSEMWFLLVPLIWMVTQTSGGSREGAQGGPPARLFLIFGPNKGPEGRKKYFGDRAPPYLGVWMTAPLPPPLISRSGYGTAGWLLLKFQISVCMHLVCGDFKNYEALLVLFSLLYLM